MKALCVVFSVIVTTLALQNPSEHALRRSFYNQLLKIRSLLAHSIPQNRRSDSRDTPHFHDAAHAIAQYGGLGLAVNDAIKDIEVGSGRANPRRMSSRRSPKINWKKGLDLLKSGVDFAKDYIERNSTRSMFRRQGGPPKKDTPAARMSSRRSPKINWKKGLDLLKSGVDFAKDYIERNSTRSMFRRQGGPPKKDTPAARMSSRRSPKINWKKGLDVLKSGVDFAKAYIERNSTRSMFRRKGGPPKKDTPAAKPGDAETPSAGGNPSWEDIFKQIVIKVISGKSGNTRRNFGVIHYDDLQQRSLHDLLRMFYHLSYNTEPLGLNSYWNPGFGFNNREVRIHSVKYSNPPPEATNLEIVF